MVSKQVIERIWIFSDTVYDADGVPVSIPFGINVPVLNIDTPLWAMYLEEFVQVVIRLESTGPEQFGVPVRDARWAIWVLYA